MNKLFKNEWDLLNLAMTEIENKGKIKFKMVKADKDNGGLLTFAGLKYKDQIYLTQEDELDQVVCILHRTFDIIVFTDHKRLSWTIYTQELAPDHIKFPF
tara:strand:- start:28 stop:327 length:300 start_codon:yes stop_codon:yes gene_type:complete